MKGKLFIISGQSGVGKNTILKAIMAKYPDFHRIVTFTTREPRPEEIPGEDHYFVYEVKFNQMIKNNEFLEYAENHGFMYGTPNDQINQALQENKNIILEIDVKGATNVKRIFPKAILIFIKYEDDKIQEAIRKRLTHDISRGKVSQEEIERRIATAKKESKYEKYYQYSVINPEGHPEKAIAKVKNIIDKEISND